MDVPADAVGQGGGVGAVKAFQDPFPAIGETPMFITLALLEKRVKRAFALAVFLLYVDESFQEGLDVGGSHVLRAGDE